ncbi:hypothetical protein [Gandjariella thermophila]|nr:hypothetical protein [Gandjariella thermophila]
MHAVTVKGQTPAQGYGHTVLIRRSTQMHKRKGRPASYDIEYFLVHAPVATTMAAMVRAAGLRWKIEDDNKTGKDHLGMDQYQVRKWTPWYRHVTMCMLAQAFLAIARAGQGKAATPGEGRRHAELSCPAALGRGDPWVAGRDRAGPHRLRHGRGHPCVMAPGAPGQSPDQPLSPTRRTTFT